MRGMKLENVALIYEQANKYNKIQLKKSCENLIYKNAYILVDQKSLVKLPSDCLKEIISRDSFSLNEVKIFELVNERHVFHRRTENIEI